MSARSLSREQMGEIIDSLTFKLADAMRDATRYRAIRPHLFVDGTRGTPGGPLIDQWVSGYMPLPVGREFDDVDEAIDASGDVP